MTTQKIKVLHVIDSIDPETGGPVQALLQFALHQSEAIETHVVTLDLESAPYIATFPIKVFALGQEDFFRKVSGVFRWTPRLKKWLDINAGQYDLVIIHGIWTYASLGTWLGVRRKRIPYLVFPHGMMDPWFKQKYPLKHLKKQLFWTLFLGRILRESAAVIFTAEDERIGARKIFWGYQHYPEAVICLGIEDRLGDDSDVLREKFFGVMPQLRGRRFLLFLSRLHPKKGCDLLIEGFSKFISEHPGTDVDLVMAGPDPLKWRPVLEEIANSYGVGSRIHWPGMLSGMAKWGAFYSAEAFILPSHQENFGIAVAEALSTGLPVLISDKINIWAEIKNSEAGLVAPNTLAGVEQLLEGWTRKSSAERRGMTKNARQCQQNYFSALRNARNLTTLMMSKINSNPPV